MSKKSVKPYEKDEFFRKWLVGLSERTKENYTNQIRGWMLFIGISPTEQIKKRMHDLTTQDIAERTFFEDQFRAYKEYLEARGDVSIPMLLRIVCSTVSNPTQLARLENPINPKPILAFWLQHRQFQRRKARILITLMQAATRQVALLLAN